MTRLKTAEALYECIPITIYLPFAYLGLRKVAQAVTSKAIIRFMFGTGIIVPCIELFSTYTKDRYYWPIVRKVYIELKESEE